MNPAYCPNTDCRSRYMDPRPFLVEGTMSYGNHYHCNECEKNFVIYEDTKP